MIGIGYYGHAAILAHYIGKLKICTFESDSTMLHTPLVGLSSGSSLSVVGSGFVYPALSKLSLMAYTPVAGIVSQMQVNDRPVSQCWH